MIKLLSTIDTDIKLIHTMQTRAFTGWKDKYPELGINPETESIEEVSKNIKEYNWIVSNGNTVGAVRVCADKRNNAHIGPLFIMEEYRNYGYAQETIKYLEEQNSNIELWTLTTILQEKSLIHLYDKLGFQQLRHKKLSDTCTLVFYIRRKYNGIGRY